MDFHEIIKILVSLVGIILSLFLILYSLSKAKRNSLLVWYISLQALILLWSLISFMETFFSQPISWRLLQIKYFSICLIGLFWLLFCFELTNKKIAVKAKLLLAIPPVVSYLFMITTKYHNLFYDFNGKRSFGILFWINTIEVYIYTLIGTFFLIKYFFQDKKQTRFQSVIFVQASIIPLVANFVYLCFRFKIDITPLSFVISLLLLLLANTKYRFLNIYPITLNSVVGSMKEGFFVIDSYNNIVNYNISFMNEIGYRANIRPDCSVDGLMEFFKNNVSEEKDYLVLYDAIKNVTRETVKGKLTLDKPINKTYQVIVQPVLSKNCNIVGRLVTFSDVSLYMNLLKELHNKNSDLLLANEQLKEYAQASQKLAIADERNRISMELHDILGHTLTTIILQLEISSVISREKCPQLSTQIEKTITIAKSGLKEVKSSVVGLKSIDNKNGILVAINELIHNLKSMGVNMNITMDGDLSRLSSSPHAHAVLRICQEASTNSIRHGNASDIDIILQIYHNNLKLFIFDNGRGCSAFQEGNGLYGMRKRVKMLNCTIVFGSNGERGFNIHIEIPLGGAA